MHSIRRTCHRRLPAFTLIELLVVIVILGLLISLVTAIAGRAIRQQKVRNTQQIMQNVMLAIEQFATEQPLREVYNRKGRETFGEFPPYQLANHESYEDNHVAWLVESEHSLIGDESGDVPETLVDRLACDLSGRTLSSISDTDDWVVFPNSPPESEPGDGNDDIRALYAYLRAFSPDSLGVIPETALSSLDSRDPDYINPRGTGINLEDEELDEVDVLGIHDAWDVPLDYMLYVKVEYKVYIDEDGVTRQGFRVIERRPVLRSRGIKREVYDEWVKSDDDPLQRTRRLSPPDKWLFSEPFCSPAPDEDEIDEDGLFTSLSADANGWVRLVGDQESYGYIPYYDSERP